MKLIFENAYGQERIIAEIKDENEAYKEINKYVNKEILYCFINLSI